MSGHSSAGAWKVVVVGAAFLVLVVYLALEALLPRRPLDKSELELAFNILSTVGTLAAVVAALWIARQSERTASLRAVSLARAVGVRRFADLIRLEGLISIRMKQLHAAASVRDVSAELGLVAALDRRVATFTDEFLATLCPLDDRLTTQLAQGLNSAAMAIEQAQHLLAWSEAGGEQAAALILGDQQARGICLLALFNAQATLREVIAQLGQRLNLEQLRPPGWEEGPPPLRPRDAPHASTVVL